MQRMELNKLKNLISDCQESAEEDCIHELSSFLEKSTNRKEVILISEFLKERGNDQSYQVLISLLGNKQFLELGFRPAILYALEVYDCTSDFRKIVNIVLDGTYHEAWYALDVIGEMEGPFSRKDLVYSLERISEIGANSEKDDFLQKLGSWLEIRLNRV